MFLFGFFDYQIKKISEEGTKTKTNNYVRTALLLYMSKIPEFWYFWYIVLYYSLLKSSWLSIGIIFKYGEFKDLLNLTGVGSSVSQQLMVATHLGLNQATTLSIVVIESNI